MASRIPHTYDALFHKWGELSKIPPAFLRALDWNESRFKQDIQAHDPKTGQPISSAIGWGQILKGTLGDFNKATGGDFTMKDMEEPDKNLHVGTWLLTKIVAEYLKNTKLKENWNDPNWAGLVAMGYGAGWSAQYGVARIVHDLQMAGVPDDQITLDRVVHEAQVLSPNLPTNVQRIYNPAWKMQNIGTAASPKWHWVSTGKPDTGYMSDPAILAHEKQIVADYIAGLQPDGMDLEPVEIAPDEKPAAVNYASITEGVIVAVLSAAVLAIATAVAGAGRKGKAAA